MICKRYIAQLPLAHPQLGTRPATQACALTENQPSNLFSLQAGTQSIEPHQPGHQCVLKIGKSVYISQTTSAPSPQISHCCHPDQARSQSPHNGLSMSPVLSGPVHSAPVQGHPCLVQEHTGRGPTSGPLHVL